MCLSQIRCLQSPLPRFTIFSLIIWFMAEPMPFCVKQQHIQQVICSMILRGLSPNCTLISFKRAKLDATGPLPFISLLKWHMKQAGSVGSCTVKVPCKSPPIPFYRNSTHHSRLFSLFLSHCPSESQPSAGRWKTGVGGARLPYTLFTDQIVSADSCEYITVAKNEMSQCLKLCKHIGLIIHT